MSGSEALAQISPDQILQMLAIFFVLLLLSCWVTSLVLEDGQIDELLSGDGSRFQRLRRVAHNSGLLRVATPIGLIGLGVTALGFLIDFFV